MATLAEERERNRRLKAEAQVREDMIKMNEERRRLAKENRFLERGGKESASVRIKKAFTQTGQTTYKGLKPLGHGLKQYGQYLAGPEPSEKKEHEHHGHKVIFKKIGKNKYKRVVVRKRQHFRPRPKPRRHSQFGPSAFGGGSQIFGQSQSLFRRTI